MCTRRQLTCSHIFLSHRAVTTLNQIWYWCDNWPDVYQKTRLRCFTGKQLQASSLLRWQRRTCNSKRKKFLPFAIRQTSFGIQLSAICICVSAVPLSVHYPNTCLIYRHASRLAINVDKCFWVTFYSKYKYRC